MRAHTNAAHARSEAIARTMETAKIRKKSKRKNPKYFKQYIAGV